MRFRPRSSDTKRLDLGVVEKLFPDDFTVFNGVNAKLGHAFAVTGFFVCGVE